MATPQVNLYEEIDFNSVLQFSLSYNTLQGLLQSIIVELRKHDQKINEVSRNLQDQQEETNTRGSAVDSATTDALDKTQRAHSLAIANVAGVLGVPVDLDGDGQVRPGTSPTERSVVHRQEALEAQIATLSKEVQDAKKEVTQVTAERDHLAEKVKSLDKTVQVILGHEETSEDEDPEEEIPWAKQARAEIASTANKPLQKQVKQLQKMVVGNIGELRARTEKLHQTDTEVGDEIANLRGVIAARVSVIENSLDFLHKRMPKDSMTDEAVPDDDDEQSASSEDQAEENGPTLVWFGQDGNEKLGVLDKDNVLRDLSGIVDTKEAESGFTPAKLAQLAKNTVVEALPIVPGSPPIMGVRFSEGMLEPRGKTLRAGDEKWNPRRRSVGFDDGGGGSGKVLKGADAKYPRVGVRFGDMGEPSKKVYKESTIWAPTGRVAFSDALGEPSGRVLREANEKWKRRRSVEFAVDGDPSGKTFKSGEKWAGGMGANFVAGTKEGGGGKFGNEKWVPNDGYWDDDDSDSFVKSPGRDSRSGSRVSGSGGRSQKSDRRRGSGHSGKSDSSLTGAEPSTWEAIQKLHETLGRLGARVEAVAATTKEGLSENAHGLTNLKKSTKQLQALAGLKFSRLSDELENLTRIQHQWVQLLGIVQQDVAELRGGVVGTSKVPSSGASQDDANGPKTADSTNTADTTASDDTSSSSVSYWVRQLPAVRQQLDNGQAVNAKLLDKLSKIQKYLDSQMPASPAKPPGEVGSSSGGERKVVSPSSGKGHTPTAPKGKPKENQAPRPSGKDSKNGSRGNSPTAVDPSELEQINTDLLVLRQMFEQNAGNEATRQALVGNVIRHMQLQLQHLDQRHSFMLRQIQDMLDHATHMREQTNQIPLDAFEAAELDDGAIQQALARGASGGSGGKGSGGGKRAGGNNKDTSGPSGGDGGAGDAANLAALSKTEAGILSQRMGHLTEEVQFIMQTIQAKVDLSEFKHRVDKLEQWVSRKADRTDLNLILDNSHNVRPSTMKASAGRRPVGGKPTDGSQYVTPPLDDGSDIGQVIEVVNDQAAIIHHLSTFKGDNASMIADLPMLKEKVDQLEQFKADADLVARKAEHEYVDISIDNIRRELIRSINMSSGSIMDTLDKSLNILRDMLDGKADALDLQRVRKTMKEKTASAELVPDGLVGYKCLACNKVMEGMRIRPMGMMFPNFTSHIMPPSGYKKQLLSYKSQSAKNLLSHASQQDSQPLPHAQHTIEGEGGVENGGKVPGPRLPPLPSPMDYEGQQGQSSAH
eukprot:TRINITY_DN61218_c0_g1_i1.p1 TRINITY_DN61218_c0_g1~~TRINITY_DN61218_c0_g1_i1.p1  ORF type:complete len:1274 (+),score=170.38 TRINITY_DN61218_c0_g1_i1:60-3881(+)